MRDKENTTVTKIERKNIKETEIMYKQYHIYFKIERSDVMGQDKIKEVREFKYPNAIVKVYIPDLTEEEKTKRYRYIKKAAEQLLKEALKQASKVEENI